MIHTMVGMLVFVFFAIIGLLVDIGFARLTQRQMVHATDSAAMEGVRLSDTYDDDDRREAVREMLRASFDDDFDVTAGDSRRYGAGPLVTLQGGSGSTGAGQRVAVADSVVYEPDPQLNLGNLAHGDMVEGRYALYDLAHLESRTYDRTDFLPEPVPAAEGLAAFLVRMRRTRDDYGLDNQPGVSSSAPELPYIFSQASTLAPELKQAGITVRATSVAAARHATTVGPPLYAYDVAGYGPIALDYQVWEDLDTNQVFTLSAYGSGSSGHGRGQTGRPDPNPFPFGPPIIPPGQVNANWTSPNWVFLPDPSTIGALSIGEDVPVSTAQGPDELRALLWAYGIDVDDLDEIGESVEVNRTFITPVYWGDVRIPWDGIPGKKWDNVDPEGLSPRFVGFGTIDILRITYVRDQGRGESGGTSENVISRNNTTVELGAGVYDGLTVTGNKVTVVGVDGGSCADDGWTVLRGLVYIRGNNVTLRNIKFEGRVVLRGNNTSFDNVCGLVTGSYEVTIRKRPGLVWPVNVSAVQTPGLAGLPGTEARDLVGLNLSMSDAAKAAARVR